MCPTGSALLYLAGAGVTPGSVPTQGHPTERRTRTRSSHISARTPRFSGVSGNNGQHSSAPYGATRKGAQLCSDLG
jgi:hypothetical protein